MRAWLQRRWYADEPPPLALKLPAALYGRIAASRRRRFEAQRDALAVPVIVVGNITVGGTGKTPFVIWLVEHLREWGWRPGVISRGYGGRGASYPLRVDAGSEAAVCGDEPLLIALCIGALVMVAPDRVAAAQALIAQGHVDVLVADDGLQHYRLPRDLEFCIVDGARGLGNGALIPAGPLREPPARLREVDLVLVNGGGFDAGAASAAFDLRMDDARSLTDSGSRRTLQSFSVSKVHAVAGIGNPERYFSSLESQGLQVLRHAFPDHHRYVPADLDFADTLPILMTEKDAVKCRARADPRIWVVPVNAVLSSADENRVRESCERLRASTPNGT